MKVKLTEVNGSQVIQLESATGMRNVGILKKNTLNITVPGHKKDWLYRPGNPEEGDYLLPHRLISLSRSIFYIRFFTPENIYQVDREMALINTISDPEKPLNVEAIGIISGDYVRSQRVIEGEKVLQSRFTYNTEHIVAFCKKHGYPDTTVTLKPGVFIVDAKKFVEASVITTTNCYGAAHNARTWQRLVQFYNLIKTTHESSKH